MMSTEETRTTWTPETELDRTLVRQELASILASPHFSHSKRYPALLGYVVEKALIGQSDRIKERNIGVEVFHRPLDYDTNNDTVVRYTAGEIRKRLTLYYHEKGEEASVQIVIPTGSYVPEFYRPVEAPATSEPQSVTVSPITGPASTLLAPIAVKRSGRRSRVRMFVAFALFCLVAASVLVSTIRTEKFHRQTALDEFWGPVLGDRKTSALISTGGVVFDLNPFSRTATADKNSQYPFVSMQMAAAIARLSSMVERYGVEYQVQPAAPTTLTEMRERPLLLVGAYNNPWTLRFLTPLRFSFSPEPDEAIVDREHKDVRWARDRSIHYGNADDYALFGRFRDTTTDSIVVFVAGIGRNGTEAAAQFVTSPHYMGLLEERIGPDLPNKNIEVVLKINVVEGKTGAPSIQAVHVW